MLPIIAISLMSNAAAVTSQRIEVADKWNPPRENASDSADDSSDQRRSDAELRVADTGSEVCATKDAR
jgi:hypothetical protein